MQRADIYISVIIPLYNKALTIQNTISSVLNQVYDKFEIVVVDDGSTDDSANIVSQFSDGRIRLITTQNNGVSAARNVGIEKADYDWIYLLDADDELLPNALSVFVGMVEQHKNVSFFTARSMWHGGEKSLPVQTSVIKHTHLALWLNRVYPAPRNMLFNKLLIARYGYFDERMSYYEDWDFSLRMAQCGTTVYTNTYVARYNQTSDGLSSKPHPLQAELAYYIPEKMQQNISFWYQMLLYENLQMTKLWWSGHDAEMAYYQDIEKEYFDWRFRLLHWCKQKILRLQKKICHFTN